MMSCRDAARLGQLVANKGLWHAPAQSSSSKSSSSSGGNIRIGGGGSGSRTSRIGAAGGGGVSGVGVSSGRNGSAGRGGPTRLISAEYARLMSTPSFPAISSCYSFLTWINRSVTPLLTKAAACAAS